MLSLPERNSLLSPLEWLWLAAVAVLALRPVGDFDTYWQLQSGRYMWETQTLITADTFSLAAQAPRLEHCWLHDLLLQAVYATGGLTLLSLLLPVVVATCAALLLCWNLRRVGSPAVVLPVLTLCLIASEPSWAIRPQLWTFLFSLLYLQLLSRGREEGWRAWGWLPVIMLPWCNLHAGCVLGLVLIGLFWCGELWRCLRGRSSRRSLGQLALAGTVTLAAAFVNPFGWRIPLGQLWAHANQFQVQAGLAEVELLGNMEWLPPTFATVPFFYLVFGLWALLLLLRRRRLDPAEAIFFLAFAYMGFGQVRHTTLVSLLAGCYLPAGCGELTSRLPGTRLRFVPAAALARWGSIACLVALVALRAGHGTIGWGEERTLLPAAATDFVTERKLPANLYNAYDWGGYLMWRLYPDYLVFVDGRQDSREHFLAADTIDNAKPGWEQLLADSGVNTLLIRTCYYDTGEPLALVTALSRNPAWALVYRDEVALVYVRRDAAGGSPELAALPPREAFRTMLAEASRLYAEDAGRHPALLAMGRASFQLGDAAAARGYYQRYLEIDPKSREAGMALQRLGGQ